MSHRLIIVRDGLEQLAAALATDLRKAGLPTSVVARVSLAAAAPGDIVLLRMSEPDPIAACWQLRRQGHRWIVALTIDPSTDECIRLLSAGADAYVPVSQPRAELIARLRSLLRVSAWIDDRRAAAEVYALAIETEEGEQDVSGGGLARLLHDGGRRRGGPDGSRLRRHVASP